MAVIAKGCDCPIVCELAGRSCWNVGQRALGGRKIAGIERIADGVKIVDELDEGIQVRGLIRVGRRKHAGYRAHIRMSFNSKLFCCYALLLSAGAASGL